MIPGEREQPSFQRVNPVNHIRAAINKPVDESRRGLIRDGAIITAAILLDPILAACSTETPPTPEQRVATADSLLQSYVAAAKKTMFTEQGVLDPSAKRHALKPGFASSQIGRALTTFYGDQPPGTLEYVRMPQNRIQSNHEPLLDLRAAIINRRLYQTRSNENYVIWLVQETTAGKNPKTDCLLVPTAFFENYYKLSAARVPYGIMMEEAWKRDLRPEGIMTYGNLWAEDVAENPGIEIRQLERPEFSPEVQDTKAFLETLLNGNVRVSLEYRVYLKDNFDTEGKLVPILLVSAKPDDVQKLAGLSQYISNTKSNLEVSYVTREIIRRADRDQKRLRQPISKVADTSTVEFVRLVFNPGSYFQSPTYNLATSPKEEPENP